MCAGCLVRAGVPGIAPNPGNTLCRQHRSCAPRAYSPVGTDSGRAMKQTIPIRAMWVKSLEVVGVLLWVPWSGTASPDWGEPVEPLCGCGLTAGQADVEKPRSSGDGRTGRGRVQ